MDPVLLPRFGVVLGIFILILFFSICFKKSISLSFEWTKQSKWLYLLGAVYILSTALGVFYAINPSAVYMELARSICFVTGLILFVGLIRANPHYVSFLTKAMLCSTSIIAVIGLIDFVQLQGSLGANKFQYGIRSLMAHKNLMASALFMGIPLSIYLILFKKNIWRYLAILNLFASLLLIIVVQSRAVWLALLLTGFLGILGLVYWTISNKKAISRKALIKTSVFAGLFLLGGFIVLQTTYLSKIAHANSLKNRLTSMVNYKNTANEHTATINERLVLWDNTLQVIKDQPLMGVGAGNWKIYFPSKGLSGIRAEQGVVNFQRPHNDFLWIWSEKGLLGILSWLGLFVYAFVLGIRFIRQSQNLEDRVLIGLCLLGLLGYGIISFFDFPSERCLHLLYLGVYLGIVVSFGVDKKTLYRQDMPCLNKEQNADFQINVLTSLLILCIGSSIITVHRIIGESHLVPAIQNRHSKEVAQNLIQFTKAGNYFFNMDSSAIPLHWYIGEQHYRQGNKEQALYHFKQAYKVHPYQVNTLNNLGSTYHSLGQKDKAILYYKQALELAPQFQESNLNLAAIYFNDRKIDEALHYLLQCPNDLKNKRYALFLSKIFPKRVEQIIEKLKQKANTVERKIVLERLQELQKKPEWMAKIHGDILQYKEKTVDQNIVDNVLHVLDKQVEESVKSEIRALF